MANDAFFAGSAPYPVYPASVVKQTLPSAYDGGDDLEFATTPAALNIKVENAPEQPRPTQPRRRALRVFIRGRASILRWTRHNKERL